jgi:hypothetical protein
MKHLPSPRRLLNALVPLPGGARQDIEPVLLLDSLPPLAGEAPAQERGARLAIEQLLEEGSRRVYKARGEAEVIEVQRR